MSASAIGSDAVWDEITLKKKVEPDLAADLENNGAYVSPEILGVKVEGGIKVRFAFNDPGRNANYEQTAQAQLTALDADKNGYLEKKEFPENAAGPSVSFADIDADKDEKLYPKELAAYLEKQQALMVRMVERKVRSRAQQLYETRGQGEGQEQVVGH